MCRLQIHKYFQKAGVGKAIPWGRGVSSLSLQYLASLSFIFVTGSRFLEHWDSIFFTSTKYSMSTLCFTMGIHGKIQVGLLEKGTAFPCLNLLIWVFFPCIKKSAVTFFPPAEISEIILWYWVHAMNHLGKVIL